MFQTAGLYIVCTLLSITPVYIYDSIHVTSHNNYFCTIIFNTILLNTSIVHGVNIKIQWSLNGYITFDLLIPRY